MAKYASLVRQKLSTLTTWKLEHILRDSNERTDALAIVATSLPITETIYLLIYYQPGSSILHTQVSQVEETPPSWMDPIRLYIVTGELLDDRSMTHKVQIQSARFSLIDGQLYKRSLGGPYLKCLTPEQGQYVLFELHEGICGNHPGGRILAHRAHMQGYYLPTMKSDATDYVKKCYPYHRMSPIMRSPMQDLISISSPCPFAQWGIDIVGPFPTAPAQKKLLLAATDYFSKWIEVDAFASIKDRDVTRFIWKNIVCRFGIPRSIISDNGPQFDSRVYRDFCQDLKIRNLYSTPWYPQGNGQACDAPKPGGPLTACQPAEYSGCRVTRRHFRKYGRVSFIRGALPKHSTCINLSQTVQYNPKDNNMDKNGLWGPYNNIHQHINHVP